MMEDGRLQATKGWQEEPWRVLCDCKRDAVIRVGAARLPRDVQVGLADSPERDGAEMEAILRAPRSPGHARP